MRLLQFALNIVLLGYILKSLIVNLKRIRVIGLIVVGVLSVTLMSIMDIGSGRLAVSFGIIGISIFVLMFFKKNINLSKLSLMGIFILCLFLFSFLLSYIYSPAAGSEYGVWKIRQFLVLAFIPSVLILIVGKIKGKEMEVIEKFIVFTGIITAIAVLYNAYAAGGLSLFQSDWFERQTIGEMNPIWLSRFLGLSLLVLQSPRFEKKPLLVLSMSLFLIMASLMTGSKTVLYFTLPVILIYRFISGGITKKLVLNIVIFSGIASVVVWFINSINSQAFLNRFSLQSGTIGQRESMYQISFDAYMQGSGFNLLFGNGGGTIGASLGYGFVREYPHNLIIEILYELGLFGFLALISIVVLAVIVFIRGKRNWLFFAFIIHFLFSLTSGDLASNDLVFVMFALYLISDKEDRIKPKRRIRFSIR